MRKQIAATLVVAALFAVTVLVVMRPSKASPATQPAVELLCGPTKSYQLLCAVAVQTPEGQLCGIVPYRQSANAMELLAAGPLHGCQHGKKAKGPAS